MESLQSLWLALMNWACSGVNLLVGLHFWREGQFWLEKSVLCGFLVLLVQYVKAIELR